MIIAPLVVISLITPKTVQKEISAENNTDLERINLENQAETDIDANFSTMIFAPTLSQEEGIYFTLRKGVDSIAYFGISTVYYLIYGTYLTMEFPGSNKVIPVGEFPSGSVTNYFFGSDKSQWKTGLTDYTQLVYKELYAGC